MTNFMTKLKTGIAIGALVVGTLIAAQSAQAIPRAAIIGGYEFSSPWNEAVKNKEFQTQKLILELDGWIFATKDIIDQAIANEPLPGYDEFVTLLGYDTVNGIGGGTANCETSFCDIRLASVPFSIPINGTPEHHYLFDDSHFSISNISDTYTGESFAAIGALGYRIAAAPSPEVTGLMLGGLALMGFAALRRK